MFVVITGLDGSEIKSISTGLREIDKGSSFFIGSKKMDENVSRSSPLVHVLYYFAANAWYSELIKTKSDYKNSNVYYVKSLLDTIVSSQVTRQNLDLGRNIFSPSLKPDLTLFVYTNKTDGDQQEALLDDAKKREFFLEKFQYVLDPKTTIFVNNREDLNTVVKNTYARICQFAQAKAISNEVCQPHKITSQQRLLINQSRKLIQEHVKE